MSRIVSRAAGLLPPSLRRTAAGAWLDLKGLPARITDPQRRGEAWQALHNVGGGDFLRAGEENLALLVARAGLTASSDILDIGCGTGRMAWPLAAFLAPQARYVGFDVSRRAIAACRARFRTVRPDFTFVEADVANREYRARAATTESAFSFPVLDASVDVAFATSVFSHMVQGSIRRYLAETARALRPGGRFLFTAYALTPERLAGVEAGRASLAFRPWRDGAMVVDPRSPERAIAHPLGALQDAVAAAGLTLDQPMAFGRWAEPSTYDGAQDLFVARKAGPR